MAPPLAPFVSSFATNSWLFGSAVGSIPEREADRRLHERLNSARGIAVHLVMARHSLGQLLGAQLEALPWSDVGEGFEAGFKPGARLPELATVLAAWKRLDARFQQILVDASDAALAQPSPLPIPGLARPTVADFAAVNVVHESYHLGQLGMLAKSISGAGIMTPAPV